MHTTEDGLILGRCLHACAPCGFQQQHYSPPRADDLITAKGDAHLMTIAPTGTGKTSGPVIVNALLHPGQVIVFDTKGEVYRVTGRHRRKMGRVHLIDLRDRYGATGSLNPIDLALLGGSEVSVLAQTLAADLVERTGNEKEPFWNDWAETLIAGAIAYVMEDMSPEKRNLRQVYDLFHADDVKYKLAMMLDNKEVTSVSAFAAFSAFLQINADMTFSGILSTTQQQLRLYGSELVKRVTSNTTISLKKLLDGDAMTIYIIIPPHRLRAYRSLLRLLVSSLIMAFTLRKAVPRHCTLMLCDEIGNLGRIDAFVTAATLLRGWGVTLWSFWQSVAQIEQYGADAKTLIDNAGVIQLFGARNYRMAQDFVNLVGGISADEIVRLPPDEQILLQDGGIPVRAKAVRYYLDPLCSGLFDSNPVIRAR